MSLIIIVIVGVLLQKLAEWLKIPSLLLFLLAGFVLGPFGIDVFSTTFLSYSEVLRTIALYIILLRAGLGLSKSTLRSVGKPALLMSFVPGVIEGFSITFLSMVLLNMSFYEAGMLGFIIAAVSPAVVVPAMIKLEEEKLGTEKGIPSIILAGASLDDVFAISIFSIFSSLYFNQESTTNLFVIILVPLILYGIYRLGKFLNKYTLLLLVGFCYFVPYVSLLAVMILGFGFRSKKQVEAQELSDILSKVWYFAQMVLFMLVGASFDPLIAKEAGMIGVLIIFLGLIARTVGVYLALTSSNLNSKERLFCAIAYLPKATVQAAMGGVPLALGTESGAMILAISILAILLSTPLGSLGMMLTKDRLLKV